MQNHYLFGRLVSGCFYNGSLISLHAHENSVSYVVKTIKAMFQNVDVSIKPHKKKKFVFLITWDSSVLATNNLFETFIKSLHTSNNDDKWEYMMENYVEVQDSLSESDFWSFIRGVVDGCGTPNIHENVLEISLRHTRSFLTQITQLLKNRSIESKLELHDRGYSKLHITGLNLVDFLFHCYENTSTEHEYSSPMLDVYRTVCSVEGNEFHFKFKRTIAYAIPPTKVRATDSGYDLTILNKIKEVNGVEYFDTGIVVEPPLGYYFDLVPRSSLSKTGYMLANSVGVIDRGYRASILVPLVKICKDAPEIVLPLRAVQIIPRKIQHFTPIEVKSFDVTERGTGGFGSTN